MRWETHVVGWGLGMAQTGEFGGGMDVLLAGDKVTVNSIDSLVVTLC